MSDPFGQRSARPQPLAANAGIELRRHDKGLLVVPLNPKDRFRFECKTFLLPRIESTLLDHMGGTARAFWRRYQRSLIAGTYTPFTLGVMRGAWGWTLFGIVWSLAAMGIVLRATGAMKHPWLSTLLYIAMGWLVLISAKHVCLVVPYEGLVWLLIGGIAYTAGVVFYASDRIRYFHFVWHVFVLVGTTCHFIAVVGYAV